MRTKLQPGETVALVVRKHWIVLVKPALFLVGILLYLPVRHVKLLGFEALLNYMLPYATVLSVTLFLYRYLDRHVNIWVVTDRRLIDEWGVLTHKSKENPLDKINDIVVGQTILGRLFRYGSISVQTAATAGETIIEFVERPEELKQSINAQKAMRTEMLDEGGDHQKRLNPPRILLLHKSVRPPFSFSCPHCGGEIMIDCTGKAADHSDLETNAPTNQRVRPESTSAVTTIDGDSPPSFIEEMPPAISGSNAVADPFGWKKHSR